MHELCQQWPVVQIQVNRNAAKVGLVTPWHVATKTELELFTPRSAEERRALDGGLAISRRRGIEVHPKVVIAAGPGRVYPPSSCPARHEMKVPAEIKVPWRQKSNQGIQECAAEHQRERRLRQAAETASTAGSCRMFEGTHKRFSLSPPPGSVRSSRGELNWIEANIMTRLLFVLLAASAAFAADDPWARVKDLKTGTELRIYKKGAAQPILAKSDEVTEDNLIVVVRNEQIAIAKDLVDRIDYRPNRGGRVATETKSGQTEPDPTPQPPGHGSEVPGTSTSSSVGIGSKPDFETIYKRTAAPPRK